MQIKLQDGKDHEALSPDEATLCLAADFFTSLQWKRGLQRSTCVMPDRLAVQELLQVLQTSTLRRAWWHLIIPSAELFPLPAPVLRLCDTGRQGDSQVASSSLTCWWLSVRSSRCFSPTLRRIPGLTSVQMGFARSSLFPHDPFIIISVLFWIWACRRSLCSLPFSAVYNNLFSSLKNRQSFRSPCLADKNAVVFFPYTCFWRSKMLPKLQCSPVSLNAIKIFSSSILSILSAPFWQMKVSFQM